MANLTGPSLTVAGKPTSLGSTDAQCPLGTKALDTAGNVYIYLQAGESFVAGEFCVYDSSYVATQLGIASRGPIALVDGTMTSDENFWGMIEGVHTSAIGSSDITSAGQLIRLATTDIGSLTEGTSAAVGIIFGALSRSACSTATSPVAGEGYGLFTVQLFRPYTTGLLESGSS